MIADEQIPTNTMKIAIKDKLSERIYNSIHLNERREDQTIYSTSTRMPMLPRQQDRRLIGIRRRMSTSKVVISVDSIAVLEKLPWSVYIFDLSV